MVGERINNGCGVLGHAKEGGGSAALSEHGRGRGERQRREGWRGVRVEKLISFISYLVTFN